MKSGKKSKVKKWLDNLDFKKQSLTGKIILISTVFILGSFLIYTLLVVSLDRWDELGSISLWVLFGWFFFVILLYISLKLISLIIHKEQSKKLLVENEEISSKSVIPLEIDTNNHHQEQD